MLIRCGMLKRKKKKNSCLKTSVCLLSAGLQLLWTKFIFSLFAPHTLQITREILNISPGRTPTCSTQSPSVCPLVTVLWERPPWRKPPQTPKALKSKLCGPPFWCVKLFLSPCLLSAVCLLVFASLCLFGGTWCFTQGTRNAVYCVLAHLQVTFLWPAPLLPCDRAGSVDSHWPFLMMSWLPRHPLADPCRITPSLRPCRQGCTYRSQCTQLPSLSFSQSCFLFSFPLCSLQAYQLISPSLPSFYYPLLPCFHFLVLCLFIFFAFFNSLPHFSHSR